MNAATAPEPAAADLRAAVDALGTAVEHLIKLVEDGALGGLGAFGLVETMQAFETVRNKLPVVDRAIIQYGTEQGVPSTLSERSMTQVVMDGCGCRPGRRPAGSRPPSTSPTGRA